MNVHIIIQSIDEDYHGTYNEVIEVHQDKDVANARVKQLEEKNLNYNVSYDVETYPLKTN